MSVDLAKPFLFPLNDISDARLNAKTWMVDTSENVFNFIKNPGQFFMTTDDGHGYVKDQPYFISTDGTTLIPVGVKKHAHSKDTDAEGGLMIEQFLANIGNLQLYFGQQFIDTDFFKNTNGTGALVQTTVGSNSAYIEIDTGTSTDGYANIRKVGNAIDFAKKSAFMARAELNGTIANYILRLGIDAEMINDANDPTTRSYGIEACSGQTNWQTWSCDGSSRSVVATSYAVDTSIHTWMGQHYPATPNIIFTRDNDTANAVTKTTEIPTSNIGVPSHFFGAGVKSTTSSQAKEWRLRGIVVYGGIGTTNWKWYAS